MLTISAPSRGCCALDRRHKALAQPDHPRKRPQTHMQQGSVHDTSRTCSDETDMGRVRLALAADPIWAAYALADLQPEFAADCRWMTARDAEGDAVALIYCGLQPPVL